MFDECIQLDEDALAFVEDAQRRMQAGLNAYLGKPVEPDELFETHECPLAL